MRGLKHLLLGLSALSYGFLAWMKTFKINIYHSDYPTAFWVFFYIGLAAAIPIILYLAVQCLFYENSEMERRLQEAEERHRNRAELEENLTWRLTKEPRLYDSVMRKSWKRKINDLQRTYGTNNELVQTLKDYCQNYPNQSPLYQAAENGQTELLRTILESDILEDSDFYEIDAKKNTLLHHAFKNEHYDIVKLLLEYLHKYHFDFLFYCQNKDDLIPFHYALRKKDFEIIRLAVQQDDLTQINDHGQTKLHFACLWKEHYLVKMLLNSFHHQGIDVNFPDAEGRTPLHYACKSGILGTIDLFIKHQEEHGGIDFKATDKYGCRAIDYCVTNGFQRIDVNNNIFKELRRLSE